LCQNGRWHIELAFNERAVDYQTLVVRDLGRTPSLNLDVGEAKLRWMRSTPIPRESMIEKFFECFARTGVNTLGTMLPSWNCSLIVFANGGQLDMDG